MTYWRIKGKYLNGRGTGYDGSYDKVFEGSRSDAKLDAEGMGDGTDVTSIARATAAEYAAYRGRRDLGNTLTRPRGARRKSESAGYCSKCKGPHVYKHGKA